MTSKTENRTAKMRRHRRTKHNDQQKRAQALRVRVQLRHDLLELADGRVDRVDLAEEQRELGVLFLGLAEERLEPGRGVRELAVLGRGEVVQPLEQAELVERRCVVVLGGSEQEEEEVVERVLAWCEGN